MRIGLAQVNPCVADLEGNVALCLRAIQTAAAGGAELVVLPELALPGCHPRDILCDASFVEAVGHATADLAARASDGPPVIIGTVLPAPSRVPGHPGLLNVAMVLEGGQVIASIAKQRLAVGDVQHEPRWFVPGPPAVPVTLGGSRIAVAVGDDEPVPEAPADLQLTICASHRRPGAFQRSLQLRGPGGRPQVRVNMVGGNDELVLDGRSSAWDARGRAVALLPPFAEEVRVVDLAADEPVSPATLQEPPWQEEILAALVLGTRDFARKNRIGRLVLGLSGGIDSALVAVIAAEAVGAEHVMAVAMPSRFTDPRSTEWARRHAADLGLSFEVVELEPLHAAAERTLGDRLVGGTAAENVQARLRAVILMAMVNHGGGLLLCTSNKTELTLGYGTVYGDLAGGLCPIGDLTKLDVLELAHWLHQTRGVIPAEVLSRPPTAELRPGQVDPFDYATVAPAVERLVLADQSDPVMRRAEHKRHQSGVILKVSERSFGPGRQVPITRR